MKAYQQTITKQFLEHQTSNLIIMKQHYYHVLSSVLCIFNTRFSLTKSDFLVCSSFEIHSKIFFLNIDLLSSRIAHVFHRTRKLSLFPPPSSTLPLSICACIVKLEVQDPLPGINTVVFVHGAWSGEQRLQI